MTLSEDYGVYEAYIGSCGADADHPAFQALKKAFPSDTSIMEMVRKRCIESREFAAALANYPSLTHGQKEAIEAVKQLESDSWRD